MTPCDSIREDLTALLDGELPPERRTVIEEHLARCDACRALRDRLRSLDRLLVEALPAAAPSRDFEARLRARIGRQRALSAGGTWRTWIAAAAALLLLAVALFALFRPTSPGAPSTPAQPVVAVGSDIDDPTDRLIVLLTDLGEQESASEEPAEETALTGVDETVASPEDLLAWLDLAPPETPEEAAPTPAPDAGAVEDAEMANYLDDLEALELILDSSK